MESSEIEESETERHETEESDHFDCNQMLEITPIFHVNVTDFKFRTPIAQRDRTGPCNRCRLNRHERNSI